MEREDQVISKGEMLGNEPPMAETRHQEIQTTFKITPLMARVEQEFAQEGETIADLLVRRYVAEGETISAMGIAFRVDPWTVNRWIIKFNPEIDTRQNKRERSKKMWQDPQRKEWLLSRIQSPDVIASRTKSLKKYYRKNRKAAKRVGERSKKRMRERIVTALGNNPKKTMTQMAAEGLSNAEIAIKMGRAPNTIYRWFKEYHVKPAKRARRKGRTVSQETLLARKEIVKEAIVNGNFNRLTKGERQTLIELYLSNSGFPTQHEIADKFELHRQGIGEKERNALRKLERKR